MKELVEGYVTKWFSKRGFGFFSSPSLSGGIFFHVSRFREVTGTPENPVITDKKDAVPTYIRAGGKYPTLVVFEVRQGNKGLEAVRWGLKPERTWIEDLVHYKTLSPYLKGRICIIRVPPNQQWEEEEADVLGLALKDKILTVIRNNRKVQRGKYAPTETIPNGFITEEFDLEWSRPIDMPYGRFRIECNKGGKQTVVTFLPPENNS
jgi:hypothetical protein